MVNQVQKRNKYEYSNFDSDLILELKHVDVKNVK